MSKKPVIFISAVSREFKTVREIVALTLKTLKYEVDYQPEFQTSNESIREMLKKKIHEATAIFHIVGDAYGAEPPAPDELFGRCSYTQFEVKYANAINKPVFYLVAEEELSRDETADEIDKPKSPSPSLKEIQDSEKQKNYKQDTNATS